MSTMIHTPGIVLVDEHTGRSHTFSIEPLHGSGTIPRVLDGVGLNIRGAFRAIAPLG